jgi:HAD superfamily hydrolase (TIGR01509 family)
MNFIIPLCGKGERFKKEGFINPKPLIEIFDKTMIEYTIDNLSITQNDNFFILYDEDLDNHEFFEKIKNKYAFINFIKIKQKTSGASETLFIGIDIILKKYAYHKKTLIIDCDTFYTCDIAEIFRKKNENTVFYYHSISENPIYSYIELDESTRKISRIAEKQKISENANTGAYAFSDINILYRYCKKVIEENIRFNNEPYISCVIDEMLKSSFTFYGEKIKKTNVFSLGTPSELNQYINQTHAFLLDLDGTLALTDEIYFDVWCDILNKYNITLTKELFQKIIQGNTDNYVVQYFQLHHLDIKKLSEKKDRGFIEKINKIKIIPGVYSFLKKIKESGHKCCIVTNCNFIVANEILKVADFYQYIDFVITRDDCKMGKPNPEPYMQAIKRYSIENNRCFIFEDSKSGILSAKSVNPKQIIGIQTTFNSLQLKIMDINFSICDYTDFNDNMYVSLLSSSNDYLAEIKKQIIENTHLDIADIIIDSNKLKGGFIADVIQLTIILNSLNDRIMNCILKYENYHETNLSKMAKQLQLYDREYYFYDIISKYVPVNIPDFVGFVKDKNYKTCGLILENMFLKNEKNDMHLNLNLLEEPLDISLIIIKDMAKMHAKFCNRDLKAKFPNLHKNNESCFFPFFSDFIKDKIPKFKERWNGILSPTQLNLCDNILFEFTEIQNRLSCGMLTFIHGDVKSANIFYDKKNNQPYFLDWQHCAIGKGVQDLIFFIIESFDIEFIKNYYTMFKMYYYKQLIENSVHLIYEIKDFENDILDAVKFIPFFTAIWFGTVPFDELIDKNWPYFFIKKVFYLIEFIGEK